MAQKLIITTIPGEYTVRVQLDELPPRRMTKDDAHTLMAKAIEEGVTIERRTALGTIIIG